MWWMFSCLWLWHLLVEYHISRAHGVFIDYVSCMFGMSHLSDSPDSLDTHVMIRMSSNFPIYLSQSDQYWNNDAVYFAFYLQVGFFYAETLFHVCQ